MKKNVQEFGGVQAAGSMQTAGITKPVSDAQAAGGTPADEKKPLTRFGEFEFLKALAIIGLPMVHVLEEAVEDSLASPALESASSALLVLCVFGPSIFMICMGFGIGGGKSSAQSIRKTGIQFLLIGFLLNIVRWFIPGVIQSIVLKTPLIEDIDYCFQSDIYYFAGIFFIFYSYIKQWKFSTAALLVISMILLTVNGMLTPLMQKSAGRNYIISSIVGNIIYVDDTSCFPLFSWAIFPTVGIIFGEILKSHDDKYRENFMRRILDFSIIFFIAFVFFLWSYNIDAIKVLVSPNNDYITDLPNVIMLSSLACVVIAGAYYLCKLIGHTKFMGFMLKISAFIIPFYLLQWILVSWEMYGACILKVPEKSFGVPAYIISVVLITAICIFVSSRYGMRIMKVLLSITTIKGKKKPRAKSAAAKAEAPKAGEPKTEATKADASKNEEPKTEATKADASKNEEPKAEADEVKGGNE